MAYAQSEVGGATLTGTVTDPARAAVVGAKVTLTSEAIGLTRTVETNTDGFFRFQRLPLGEYNLAVDMSGFKTSRRSAIALGVGAVVDLEIRLELGTATESVTVTSETPLVETTRTQTATTVNQRDVRDLPINGRNFLDFTLLTPGVSRDPRTGDLSFGGQRGTANSLLVDGMDANNLFFGQSMGRAGGGRNPYSFSQDAVEEFQVNTSSFAPEIGRAGGGVVNAVTKSGTNDLHGNAFWFYRDREMNANTWINNARGISRQPYHYNQFGGTLGGPVKKNKLFFFLSYDGQRNLNPNPVFFPFAPPTDPLSQQAVAELTPYLAPYTTGYNNDIGLAKVDWNITDTQRLSVRMNIGRFRGQNFENGGPQSAAEHTGNSNVSTTTITGNYSASIGARLFSDTRFNYLMDDEPGEANSTQPEAQIRQNGILFLQIGRNNFSPRYTNSKGYEIIENLSWIKGRHTIKGGVDLNFVRVDNFFPGNFSGSYQFNSLADFAARRAAQFTQGFAGSGTTGALTQPNASEYGFYVQDTWRVGDRLTLTYGWRYDLFVYPGGTVLNPDPLLQQQGLLTNQFNRDTNNHAGRAGLAYKLDAAGRQILRAGYGIFYARTPSILVGTAMSQNGIQVQTYTLTSNLPTYPNILPAPPQASRTPAIYVVQPDYVQPLTAQGNLVYEAEVMRNVSVSTGYLWVRGYHLTRTRDVNLYPAAQESASFLDGTPTLIWRHPVLRPNPAFNRISMFDSGGDSTYNGLFVQVNKRFGNNFQMLANYTFSKVMDTVPDATSVVVGTGDDAKVAQDTLLPNIDRAVGVSDIRNNFVFSGLYDLNFLPSTASRAARLLLNGWQISGIFNARNGLPFSATVGGNGDVNQDGNARTDRPPFLGRNTLKLPNFYTLDMRVTKIIPLTERVRLQLIGEAFNIANHANFSALNPSPFNFNSATRIFSPVPTYLAPSNTYDPRILQLAAKINF